MAIQLMLHFNPRTGDSKFIGLFSDFEQMAAWCAARVGDGELEITGDRFNYRLHDEDGSYYYNLPEYVNDPRLWRMHESFNLMI